VVVVLAGLIFFMAPLAVLVTAGLLAATTHPRPPWWTALALVVASTAVWLVYVGLFQHETPCDGKSTGCPTVYGYDAPLPDDHLAGTLLLVAGFVVPAAWAGWRRLAPPLTDGAALALGPTVLALWAAPRGDNDGLWALIFWFLPVLGGLAAIVAAVAERVGATRRSGRLGEAELTTATPTDRLAAVAMDVAIVGGVLVVPLTALSHQRLEVLAGIVGVGFATAYLAVPLAWRGRTLGQSVVGVLLVDARTGRPISVVRAFLRSLVVVLEILAAPTLILAIPTVVEWISLVGSGRTLSDRLFGTVARSDRRPAERLLTPAK